MDNDDLIDQLLNEFNDHQLDEEQINSDENNIFLDNEINNNLELNLNKHGLIALQFDWFEGLRTGSRLVWVPNEECIYYSNAKRKNGTAYTCFHEECKARILIMDDGTAGKEIKSPEHYPHGSLYEVYKERCLFTWMKERCRTAPASVIIRNIYDEAVVE